MNKLLPDIEFQRRYRSSDFRDIGEAFISKALEAAVVYKRAAGYFSSSALANLTRGLSVFCQKPNAHIYLVVSPDLTKEDVDAINAGYENRKQIYEKAMLRSFTEATEKFESERLNRLCHLIEENILDIKVAVMENRQGVGIYHEKFGLFVDEQSNKIGFEGSLNESENGFSCNFERINVYCSWKDQNEDIEELEEEFDDLWNNETPELRIFEFPEAVKNKLMTYRKPTFDKNIDVNETKAILEAYTQKSSLPTLDRIQFQPRDYQKQAINNWAAQKFQGIFDRATGTGKTLTAYWASVALMKRLKYNLGVIIVVPYQHLVEQWVNDAGKFNIHFLVGYGVPKYKGYLQRLRDIIIRFNNHIENYFFFITTNASYRTPAVQEVRRSIKRKEVLFIADEVHNFGAPALRKSLIGSFPFRLGLSATVNRKYDKEGTDAIRYYFGKIAIHFGLKEAIEGGYLTKYEYYPVIVTLDSDERDRYLDLTEQIIKCSSKDKNGNVVLNEAGKRYAIKRARVVAVANSKIGKIRELMKVYTDEHNILVYCGSGRPINGEEDQDAQKQIETVCHVLGNELHRKIQRFTAQETIEQREQITEQFKNQDLQALVAMKCLDEGVDIPCIKYAFIRASGTNPREYVQRRGRVLRKYPGKDRSIIFDFVTLPVSLENRNSYPEDYVLKFKGLIRNEILRRKEFSSLAENFYTTNRLVDNLCLKFSIDLDELSEDVEEGLDDEEKENTNYVG